MMRITRFAVISSAFLLLSGCDDSSHIAPVIDAWYQPHAASHFYVVRGSDTIYSIAFAFGLDYRDLVAVNQLSPPYVLRSGQRLIMTHRPSQPAPTHFTARTPVQQLIVRNRSVVFNDQWHWPVRGRIIRGFTRSQSGQPGISIAGQLGEPIRAASSGIVVYSGDGVRGYGNLIIIKHNDSYLSAYAFNQVNLVNVGDQVRSGQVIARMGQNDAGRTLLYFEIRRNGMPVDPLSFLK